MSNAHWSIVNLINLGVSSPERDQPTLHPSNAGAVQAPVEESRNLRGGSGPFRCHSLLLGASFHDWLVVWNMFFFPHILGIIIPIDFHIFFRGIETTLVPSFSARNGRMIHSDLCSPEPRSQKGMGGSLCSSKDGGGSPGSRREPWHQRQQGTERYET